MSSTQNHVSGDQPSWNPIDPLDTTWKRIHLRSDYFNPRWKYEVDSRNPYDPPTERLDPDPVIQQLRPFSGRLQQGNLFDVRGGGGATNVRTTRGMNGGAQMPKLNANVEYEAAKRAHELYGTRGSKNLMDLKKAYLERWDTQVVKNAEVYVKGGLVDATKGQDAY